MAWAFGISLLFYIHSQLNIMHIVIVLDAIRADQSQAQSLAELA